MFDKLIVSDEQGAEFKGRSRYFVVSTVVVGILFISAVVFSLYAADIGLGNDEFEMSMIIAPATPDAPEPPKPLHERNQPQRSDVPIRNDNMVRLDENPIVPIAVSVTQNTGKARPYGDFRVGQGPEIDGIGDPGNISSGGNLPDGSGSSVTSESESTVEKIPDPPPVIKPKPPVPTGPVSIGVANGRATSLPKPPYPPVALSTNIQGSVNVQVTIDEYGKVVSSKAVSGHAMLRGAAEKAAWNAKFTPTLLSNVPVKVTGVIVYNFKRS